MRRAFLSLYGLIVLSVIAVGWGLDELWQYYAPEETVLQTDKDIFVLAEGVFAVVPQPQWAQSVVALNQSLGMELELLALEDFAQSKLRTQVATGSLVAVYDENGDRLMYKLFQNSEWIIRLRQPSTNQAKSFVYDLLLMVFYAAIAVVVFFWVWPLSRDLSKLEKHTRLIGRDQIPDPLHITQASTVYDLASAFNRMSQRIRDLLASHKEMTYAVSHELRTPLARMKFALEMAENSKEPADVSSRLKGVKDDVGEMESLVNQLLSYASFEQNDQPLDLQEGDLNCLIEQLITRIEEPQKIHFTFTASTEVFASKTVCEWHLMERAVSNILLNAQRHAKSAVKVSINHFNGLVSIVVEDDGPGIPEAEHERVFQSFVRLQTSINAQTRGFGLGLAIVQRIMRWHNGNVKISTSKMGGACFTLSWSF